MNLFDFLDQHTQDCAMFGSKAISTSILTKDSDTDYIALVEDYSKFDVAAHNFGFKRSTEYVGKEFTAYRKGEINLIATNDKKFFDCTILATRLGEFLQCRTKQERIIAYETIMVPNGYKIKRKT